MRTGIYLPIQNLKIDGLSGENILLHHLTRAGPVHRLVVHESEVWEKMSTQFLYEDMIKIIPEKKHRKYTQISEEFFFPLIDGMKYFTWSGKKKPMLAMNLIYPLSRALFILMIANKYKTRIYEYNFLRDALQRIQIIENSNLNQFTDEGMERVLKFKHFLKAYNSFDECGFSTNREYDIHKEFRKLLYEKEIQKLSEKKHKLGVLNIKFNQILFDIKEITTKFLSSSKFPWLALTSYQIYLLSIPESKEKTIAQILTPTIHYLLQKVSRFDLREYAPPIEKPRYYFGKMIQFNPVNSKVFIFNKDRKIIPVSGAIAGMKIKVLPKK